MSNRGKGVRTVVLGALLVLVSIVGAPIAQAVPAQAESPADGTYPALDIGAAEDAIAAQQIYRAPGAVAQFDDARVQPLLTPNTRLVIGPFIGGPDNKNQVRTALDSWTSERGLSYVLVQGLKVTIGSSILTTSPSSLAGAEIQLAHFDVTDDLVLALSYLRDNTKHVDDTTPQVAAPTSTELTTVTDALRANPVYNAPGVRWPLATDGQWAGELPGVDLRIAVLPELPVGVARPDFLPGLTAAFPGALVVVVQGRWIDAGGLDPAKIAAARNFVLGKFHDPLGYWGTPMGPLLRQMLDRFADLRSGIAFSRPEVRPVLARQLFTTLAPWALGLVGLTLGGVPLALVVRRTAAARRVEASALRVDTAHALADIARLSADVIAADADGNGSAVAAASERLSTARELYASARSSEAVRAVRDVLDEGTRLLDAGRPVAR